ncbi:serine hydrolase [Actinomadura oligospora]|uniref:serine hydrolase n=1 Tax=Actinomadura oligospora TaxID=111804 RepID=UPI000A050E2D|nr:serine hydrolase [Actinomadura oligospora]
MTRRVPRALTAALLTTAAITSTAGAAQAAPARGVPSTLAADVSASAAICTSSVSPTTAKRVGSAIAAALRGRSGSESVAVYDLKRKLWCGVGSGTHYDSASTVKATVLGALLRKVLDERRKMTSSELSLAKSMITKSDNAATTKLWNHVGRTRMQRFLGQAGMTHTRLGSGGYWGLTQITARDEIVLLRKFTEPNKLLTDKARNYGLGLMHQVVPSQRWGTPAGTPSGITWHVKNGWLPRHNKYWRVHSLGAFTGSGQSYTIVVLTRDTPSMAYGVSTIERVARAVHHGLNPGMRSMSTESVPNIPWERSDGSVPPNV